MKPINTILFDLDGTIGDPREGIVRCFQYALDNLGQAIPPEEQILRYIGPPLYESFASLLTSNDKNRIQRAVDLYRERFASKGIFENTIYPGIRELLATLYAERFRLYVATTKPTVFARQILDHFGITAYFLDVYGSELDGSLSDKRELIAHVIAREHIRPTDTAMVGDREHDVKGAVANGVCPMGTLWGYGSRSELINAGATMLCDTPQSLISYFQKSFDFKIQD